MNILCTCVNKIFLWPVKQEMFTPPFPKLTFHGLKYLKSWSRKFYGEYGDLNVNLEHDRRQSHPPSNHAIITGINWIWFRYHFRRLKHADNWRLLFQTPGPDQLRTCMFSTFKDLSFSVYIIFVIFGIFNFKWPSTRLINKQSIYYTYLSPSTLLDM